MIQPQHDPLTRAAIHYGSDKYGSHLYTPIYNKAFSHLRESSIRLLEIGVGGYDAERAGGLSLKMWANYFPYAKIVGLDINPKKLVLPPRVKIRQGSQADLSLLAAMSQEDGPFDIVIDDGSHVVDHMVNTFCFLYPLLAPNGLYAIEDTQTSFSAQQGGRADGKGTIFEVANKISLAMHRLEGYADHTNTDAKFRKMGDITSSVTIYRNIVLFQRGPNTYPSNFQLDFRNQEVNDVFDGIAAEAELNPSPGGSLSRIDMLLWAGQVDAAVHLASETADRNPQDQDLLYNLLRLTERAKSASLAATIALHLSRIR